MSMILRIQEIKKDRHVETGDEFLDITLQIIDPEYVPETIKNEAGEMVPNTESQQVATVIDKRKLAFGIDIDKEEIKKQLKAYIDAYNLEVESAKERVEQDRVDEKVTAITEDLTGGIIK